MNDPIKHIGLVGPLELIGPEHKEMPFAGQDARPSGKFSFEATAYVEPPIVGPIGPLIELAGKLTNNTSDDSGMVLGEVWAQYDGVGTIPTGTKHAGDATRTTGRPLRGDRIKLSFERVTPAAAAVYLGSFTRRVADLATELSGTLEYPRVRLR